METIKATSSIKDKHWCSNFDIHCPRRIECSKWLRDLVTFKALAAKHTKSWLCIYREEQPELFDRLLLLDAIAWQRRNVDGNQ